MWQRFTRRARSVVFFAQEEARRLGESFVSTEHLLLGLLREKDCAAAEILVEMGIPLEKIRRDLERQVTYGSSKPNQEMQLTPRAKRVIDFAYEESRRLGTNYIGTEHLLLGIVCEADGLGGRVLAKLGVELNRLREAVSLVEGRPEGDAAVLKKEYQRLDEEVRAALEGAGAPFGSLPAVFQQLLERFLLPEQPSCVCSMGPEAKIRFFPTEKDGKTHYTVIAECEALVNQIVNEPN